MRIPVMRGRIERRILVNYRVDPERIAAVLPKPFRPKLVQGHAVGGICLIRLTEVRPHFLPAWAGVSSENAAHRIAVEWDDAEGTHEGVYVPRRDTGSFLNHLAGGRVFPGEHHRARFEVTEGSDSHRVAMSSIDGRTRVIVSGKLSTSLPSGSIFSSMDEVSSFFQRGSLGYSGTAENDHFDGLELRTFRWQLEPLDVSEVVSSFFDDVARFPAGSATFDCALLMRDIEHEWHARESIACVS
jgi:hypothetical protein